MNYYIAEKEEIQSEISKINEFISNYEWLFFQVREMNQSCLHISGMVDELIFKYDFNIFFKMPHSIICPLNWRIDKTEHFIKLDEDNGLKKMISNFDVEVGYYVFRLHQDNIRDTVTDIFIAAKEIKMEIIK